MCRPNLRRSWLKYSEQVYGPVCFDCGYPIIREDDDACVCIQCGGRNRRKKE